MHTQLISHCYPCVHRQSTDPTALTDSTAAMAQQQQEATAPHTAAAALLDFLVDAPLLLPSDKKGVLKLIKGLDPSGFDLIARSGHGISVFRTSASCSRNRICSVTGMGEVEAAPRVRPGGWAGHMGRRWLPCETGEGIDRGEERGTPPAAVADGSSAAGAYLTRSQQLSSWEG